MRRKYVPLVALGIAPLLALGGCTQPMSPRAAVVAPARAPSAEAASPATQPLPRQVIRSGRIEVTVEHLDDARRRLERAADALDAQVARLESREGASSEYQLRVRPDHLDAMMDSAAALGRAGGRTVSAEDVTDQVVDVEARLGALRASRDRLRQLMDRSANVGDVVAVERELARVQGELESLEGRLAALRGQVARSALIVRLQQRHVLGPLGLLAAGVGFVIQKLFVWR